MHTPAAGRARGHNEGAQLKLIVAQFRGCPHLHPPHTHNHTRTTCHPHPHALGHRWQWVARGNSTHVLQQQEASREEMGGLEGCRQQDWNASRLQHLGTQDAHAACSMRHAAQMQDLVAVRQRGERRCDMHAGRAHHRIHAIAAP